MGCGAIAGNQQRAYSSLDLQERPGGETSQVPLGALQSQHRSSLSSGPSIVLASSAAEEEEGSRHGSPSMTAPPAGMPTSNSDTQDSSHHRTSSTARVMVPTNPADPEPPLISPAARTNETHSTASRKTPGSCSHAAAAAHSPTASNHGSQPRSCEWTETWPSRAMTTLPPPKEGGRTVDSIGAPSASSPEPHTSLSFGLERGGAEPSKEEIAEYLEKHNLQAFFAEVIQEIARHLPADPLEYLVQNVDGMVAQHRAARRYPDGEALPVTTVRLPVILTDEQEENIVRHIMAVLQTPEITRAFADKLFKQFAHGSKISKEAFDRLLEHLVAQWGLQEDDKALMLEVLSRWRFRMNAANGMRGLPLWPLGQEDFMASYPYVLRALRDRYAPIGGKVERSLFIRQNAGTLEDKYELGPRLGHGAYGEVFLATLRTTSERRVCKRVRQQQQKAPREDLVDEIDLLRGLDHPNIIRIFEYFETEEYVEMIMEPVFGGTLAQLIRGMHFGPKGEAKNERPADLTEQWTATVMGQLTGALTCAHDVVGVIHKDLKAENVLLVGEPNLSPEEVLRQKVVHVMLADFGISEVFNPDPMFAAKSTGALSATELRLSRVGGTLAYMSPEMFNGSFTEKCDMWSLGVLMFYLMTGELPYRGASPLAQMGLVCNPRKHPRWELLAKHKWSLGARLFCQQLLSKDEGMRPSASEASRDDWLLKNKSHEEVQPNDGERVALQQQILQSHLMRMVRHCITSQLGLAPLHHLNMRFQQYDSGGDGRLNLLEIRQVLEDVGIHDREDVELVIESLDSNRNGYIEYSEFMTGCLDLASDSMRQQLRAVFDVFDLDGSGAITLEELRQVLTQGANTEDVFSPSPSDGHSALVRPMNVLPDGKTVEEVMRDLDRNGTGQVEYEEFEQYLLKEHEDNARTLVAT
mmetsp:Transcript_31910/g.74665  ORF Transcript_31910/g.74665 Transcript_31910/m.74665 type:complete len:923 (-) Transcript_31910:30-2798(-)